MPAGSHQDQTPIPPSQPKRQIDISHDCPESTQKQIQQEHQPCQKKINHHLVLSW